MNKKLILVLSIALILCGALPLYSQSARDIIETETGENEYRAERIAIIVGVEKYLDRNIPDLEYSVDDANLIKSVLEGQGNFTIDYIADDAENRSPTKDNIMKALDSVIENQELGIQIKTVIFYFGGHGFNVGNVNYLAPTETEASDIMGTAVSLNDVLAKIKTIQDNGAKAMLFLDACRNDPTQAGRKGLEGDHWGDNESKGLKIMYSTSIGDYSYELDGQGIFTLYLVGGILGGADQRMYGGNEDGFVSFAEASKYVTIKLKEWSRKTGYNQTPRIETQEAMGDFFLTVVDEMAFQPPSYVEEPELIEVTGEGVRIEWETSKETLSTLYIGTEKEFSINDDTPAYYDLSKDGKNHFILLSYEQIDPKGEYYLRAKDRDFLDNEVDSQEIHIPKYLIYNTLEEQYKSDVNILKATLRTFLDADEPDYESALQASKDIVKMIENYEEILDLETEKKKYTDTYNWLNVVIEVPVLLGETGELISSEDYTTAIEKASEALGLLEEASDNPNIEKSYSTNQINRVKALIDAIEYIKKGNAYKNEGKVIHSKDAYRKAIRLIKGNSLDEYVSVDTINARMDGMPDLLKRFYVNAGIGGTMNVLNTNNIAGSISPNWNIGFNFRANRVITVGLGIDVIMLDVFAKFSLVNTTFQDLVSSEFFIKTNFLMNFAPTMGIGGGITLEYIIGFKGVFGIYFDLGIRTLYHLEYSEHIPLNIYLNAGIVFNF